MPRWQAPQRPADHVEEKLIHAIVGGTYPAGATLPGERDLAAQLGVTRPTLREALQRLARDGWITIHQGKPTQVNDFWTQGGLNVLSTLVRFDQLPQGFVTHLLEVRCVLAPAYTHAAVGHDPARVLAHLRANETLPDAGAAYAAFDWALHHILTIASGNPIYALILNGFETFYQEMACRYFAVSEARAVSRAFYGALRAAFEAGDAAAAAAITREVMAKSIALWEETADG